MMLLTQNLGGKKSQFFKTIAVIFYTVSRELRESFISSRKKFFADAHIRYFRGKLSVMRSRDYLLCQPENWRSSRIPSGISARVSGARVPIAEIFIHIGAECREIYTRHIGRM